MDTFTNNAPNWGNLVDTDSENIISGHEQSPKRIDGVRTFTDGERFILHWYYTTHIKPFLDRIKEAKLQMNIAAKQGQYLVKLQDLFSAKQKDDEKKVKEEIDQIEAEIQEEKSKLPADYQFDKEEKKAKAERKKVTWQNTKKIAAFMLVGFLIEALTFIATKSFQNETLGWDIIMTRLLFLFGIYMESAYLYIKYIKTRSKAVMVFVALSILASAACLLHVIAAALINDVPSTAENLNFGLEQLTAGSGNEETTTGLISKFLSHVGLPEFIFSSVLCFGEIIFDVTSIKKETSTKTSPKNEEKSNQEASIQDPDYTQLAISKTLEHIERLTREKNDKYLKLEQNSVRNAKTMDKIKEMLGAAEKRQNEASKECDKCVADFEASTFLVWDKINGHDRLLIKECAFRSKGKTSQNLAFEPVSQKDIETYYLSKLNNL